MDAEEPNASTCDTYAADPEQLLLVAACTGPRCRALRHLHAVTAPGVDDDTTVLRDAVRHRRDAVMISTGCLQACSHGSVVVVGSATMPHSRTFRWYSNPVLVGLTDRAGKMADLAAWVLGSAPREQTMPATLRHSKA